MADFARNRRRVYFNRGKEPDMLFPMRDFLSLLMHKSVHALKEILFDLGKRVDQGVRLELAKANGF